MTIYPAHIRIEGDKEIIQTVQEHCLNAAKYASEVLKSVGLSCTAYLAALLHDMGKFKTEFKEYIETSARDAQSKNKVVNHTFAGVRFVLERYHSSADMLDEYTAEVIAYAIGAHHGLFDCLNEEGNSGFRHRMYKEKIAYEESKNNFLSLCASEDELDELFIKAKREIEYIIELIKPLIPNEKERFDESSFYLGLLVRLILSAVIEGDRRDTAEFMNKQFEPQFFNKLDVVWNECLTYAEEQHRILREGAVVSPVNEAREAIAQQCRTLSENEGKVFRLNAPTGAGKTLSILLAVLDLAKKKHKSRIIFTFPLLTILDQNAKEIRRNIPREEYILEHHSNVVRVKEDSEECEKYGKDQDEKLDYHELLAQTWHAPIVITTLVQFLNTLFDGKTTCIRRFQSLCNSIIVIDEVQTVPLKMISLFNLAVNFLSEVCGATVILCSATQPALGEVRHPLLEEICDLVSYDPQIWEAFKRTELIDAGIKRLSDIPEFAQEVLDEASSLLIVCNKKDEARNIFIEMKDSVDYCFHLSASMCSAHRKNVLDEIKQSLSKIRANPSSDCKVVCVATQVVEAGVDISFERVIRLTAGLDNVIQAIGRENRNGEDPNPAPAYVVTCSDEKLSKLKDIERAKNATINVLQAYKDNPSQFDNDLTSDAAIKAYYRSLYKSLPRYYSDYCIDNATGNLGNNLQINTGSNSFLGPEETLYSLLSANRAAVGKAANCGEKLFWFNQAFAKAGKAFSVFDDNTVDVIVPYGEEGKRLIADFESEKALYDPTIQEKLLQKAKAFSIGLYSYDERDLCLCGGLREVCDGLALALLPDFYNEDYGFEKEPQNSTFLGV